MKVVGLWKSLERHVDTKITDNQVRILLIVMAFFSLPIPLLGDRQFAVEMLARISGRCLPTFYNFLFYVVGMTAVVGVMAITQKIEQERVNEIVGKMRD